MLQILQHVGVCSHDAGGVHVTPGPEEQQVGALSLGRGPPCRIAGQHEPGPIAHHPAGRPTAPTRQARALCAGRPSGQTGWPAALCLLGGMADEARQSASFTCVRLLAEGWGAVGGLLGVPLSDGGAPGEPCSAHMAGCWVGRALTYRRAAGREVGTEVALEALLGDQVGQAAELGRAACLAAWHGLSWALL